MKALFPINPRYAHAVVEGSKTIEVRRGRMNDSITEMVVYSTKPDRVVLGAVDVVKVEQFSAPEFRKFILARHDPLEADYLAYAKTAQWVSVLHLARPRRLASPVPLQDMFPGMRAPQFWQRIEAELPRELL